MKFNKLVPELNVSNFKKSLDFYKLIGFKVEYEREQNKFAFLSFQGSQLMIEENNNNWNVGKLEYPLGRGINFQIEVESVTQIIEKLKKNKIKLFKEKMTNKYMGKTKTYICEEVLVQDPDGYLLRFSKTTEVKE
jgi:hypothetical protein